MKTWNNEFRDMSAAANYPFTAGSSLKYGDTQLDQGFILDMILYPLELRTMPYYMATIRGGKSEEEATTVIIKDINYDIVCTFTPVNTADAVPGHDAYGRVVGIMTYDRAKLLDVVGKVGFGEFNFEREDAEICAGCCYSVPVQGTLDVETQAGDNVTGDVHITAAGGLTFALSGSDVSLNMYGEMRTLEIPVKSINGVSNSHYWLAADPDSAVRVVTKASEKAVTVGKNRDFTYDDQT